jgi:hypothetical protein
MPMDIVRRMLFSPCDLRQWNSIEIHYEENRAVVDPEYFLSPINNDAYEHDFIRPIIAKTRARRRTSN